jgi:hypothetical protein
METLTKSRFNELKKQAYLKRKIISFEISKNKRKIERQEKINKERERERKKERKGLQKA